MLAKIARSGHTRRRMNEPLEVDTFGLTGRELADGKYAVAELIGRGAMGDVYAAMHTTLHRKVADQGPEPCDDADGRCG